MSRVPLVLVVSSDATVMEEHSVMRGESVQKCDAQKAGLETPARHVRLRFNKSDILT